MFGWLKKASQDRVLKTMDALAYLANLTTAYKINFLLKESKIYDNKEIGKIIAVRTNYLFGKNSSELIENVDITNEKKSAIIWLSNDNLFCELVVQSLRVMNTSRIAKGGEALVLGEEILTTYGKIFPEKPSPDMYKILVFKAIDALPLDDKIDVIERGKKLGLS